MAQILTERVPDLPDVARNFLNWRCIEADQETGRFVIFWGDDSEV